MTIITTRRTVIIILCLLALFFLYLSLVEGNKPKETFDNNISQGLVVEEDLPVINPEELAVIEREESKIEENLEGTEFFMEYRLERDRRRAQEIELLQSMFNSPNGANEIRQEAQQKLLEMTNSLDQELTLETLIMAKGYADAVAFVQQGQVTIIVQAVEFSDEDAARIADLVSRTTGYPLSKITIFAKK